MFKGSWFWLSLVTTRNNPYNLIWNSILLTKTALIYLIARKYYYMVKFHPSFYSQFSNVTYTHLSILLLELCNQGKNLIPRTKQHWGRSQFKSTTQEGKDTGPRKLSWDRLEQNIHSCVSGKDESGLLYRYIWLYVRNYVLLKNKQHKNNNKKKTQTNNNNRKTPHTHTKKPHKKTQPNPNPYKMLW